VFLKPADEERIEEQIITGTNYLGEKQIKITGNILLFFNILFIVI